MEKKNNTQYASIKEYAQKHNFPETRIRDCIKCGKIPNVIRGNRKQYLIPFIQIYLIWIKGMIQSLSIILCAIIVKYMTYNIPKYIKTFIMVL